MTCEPTIHVIDDDPAILASLGRAVQPYLLKVIEMMDLRPPSAAA